MSLELLQDIHLSDDSFWTEFQYYWKNGNYSRALQILEENQELVTKYVSAEWFNSLTTFIYQLETLPDDFNKKQIKVSYLPPDLEVGDIWFQLELGEINISVKMSIIPAGSTSVTTTYSNTLINALAFKNNEEVLVNQVINETNHSVTFSIGQSLDYPVICMVYFSNNSNLEINTVNFSIGDEMFAAGCSGEILSVICLQDNKKNIVNIYDYNSNELFFKMNPATENGIIRICTIPSANLDEILNVSSGNLSGTILRLTCDGYMVNSILTQTEILELGINNVSGSVVTFNDGVGGMALKSLTVNIDPVQAGSGDPSPDNVRPISGWSACNVWVKPTYDPTANPTAAIQLGQIVYGGTLDVTNGVLTVDRSAVLLDGTNKGVSSVATSGATGNYFCVVSISGAKLINDTILCNMLTNDGTSIANIGNIYYVNNGNIVFVLPDQTLTTVSAVNDWLSSNNIQISYILATPITIPLTPTQIDTLLGQNNIWADTGDTSLQYYTTSDSPSSTEELTVENFVLSDISFDLNKAIISKDSNDSTIKCTLYYT